MRPAALRDRRSPFALRDGSLCPAVGHPPRSAISRGPPATSPSSCGSPAQEPPTTRRNGSSERRRRIHWPEPPPRIRMGGNHDRRTGSRKARGCSGRRRAVRWARRRAARQAPRTSRRHAPRSCRRQTASSPWTPRCARSRRSGTGGRLQPVTPRDSRSPSPHLAVGSSGRPIRTSSGHAHAALLCRAESGHRRVPCGFASGPPGPGRLVGRFRGDDTDDRRYPGDREQPLFSDHLPRPRSGPTVTPAPNRPYRKGSGVTAVRSHLRSRIAHAPHPGPTEPGGPPTEAPGNRTASIRPDVHPLAAAPEHGNTSMRLPGSPRL